MTLTDNLETARRSGAESLGKVVTVTEKPVSTTSSIQSSFAMRGFFHLFIWCLPLTGLAFAQADQSGPDKVPDAIAKDAVGRIKQGIILQADVDRLAAAGAVQVIPELKEQFALSQDEVGKGRLASALVKLGDKDVTYWDYLVKEARSAIESDTPSPMQFDSKGAFIKGPSPEFIAWAKARNVTTDSALEAAMYRLPSKVVFLGATGDRRAVPLLRQALSSANYMIQIFAAQELAKLQDKASIPLIIEACRRAPADVASAIAAHSLARFDDSTAQSAAKAFPPAGSSKAIGEDKR